MQSHAQVHVPIKVSPRILGRAGGLGWEWRVEGWAGGRGWRVGLGYTSTLKKSNDYMYIDSHP